MTSLRRRIGMAAAAAAVTAGVGCASPAPLSRAASPESIAALATAPRIAAVHYHDRGPMHDGDGALVGAPVARVKARFLEGLRERLRLTAVRDVTEPRFPYFCGSPGPSVTALQRTYHTGYVLDFYGPWRYVEVDDRGAVWQLPVQARLVSLDDLSVLWAHECRIQAEDLPAGLATEPVLRRADGCADALLDHFLEAAR